VTRKQRSPTQTHRCELLDCEITTCNFLMAVSKRKEKARVGIYPTDHISRLRSSNESHRGPRKYPSELLKLCYTCLLDHQRELHRIMLTCLWGKTHRAECNLNSCHVQKCQSLTSHDDKDRNEQALLHDSTTVLQTSRS
jgi:hypothetical protein